MINLYKVLHLSPYASESEIRLALQEMETSLNERTIKAVYEWLLVDSVRARYDMKLRETYPDYFAQFRVPVAQNGGNFAKKQVGSSRKVVKHQTLAQQYVYPRADVPELWNPNAAVNWCIVFNVVFGAVIHALNWSELGEDDLAQSNWIVAGIGFCLILCAMVFSPVFSFLNFVLLIVWYFALAKKQAAYIKKELRGQYQKKGWGIPMGITILVGLGLILLLIVLSALVKSA
ncbi:hypothetical protein [Alysiella filiformis]|uniref:Uncharacterized protein n=1 Tax=Alysiella filiformis DSM 16848 TaxID=1120981 RepID=A0A286E1Y7_9NEIS|nr:hypothetical protein [Alysiella filiformis]QMT30816.1 hypothetical protein H3L97_08725 [Alysiella filiformis]UBQ56203.1 hypothetical protein JF568_11750 [Alysiella filiformis DSM 16848]SOD64899.1 hypothetical protein SAMN02746062_00094 [Alysiella filiformis DSM 16848]